MGRGTAQAGLRQVVPVGTEDQRFRVELPREDGEQRRDGEPTDHVRDRAHASNRTTGAFGPWESGIARDGAAEAYGTAARKRADV